MVLFGGAQGFWGRGDGGKKVAPSKNLSHITYNDETWDSHTLPKKDSEKNKSSDKPLRFS